MRENNPLCRLELFENVASNTRDQIWQAGKIKEFPKGKVIISAKELLNSVYIQLSGKSIIYNLTHNGKRKIIFILGKGDLLNEHILCLRNTSLFYETIEASQIFIIPATKFLCFMEEDFTLTKSVLIAQERKIWRLGHQLKNTMGSIYMERKLAAKLWKLSRDFGKQTSQGIEIDIDMTITFLADMLGAPRETTSRLFKTLTDHELLKKEKKRITIVNPKKMAHFYKTGEFDEP